MVIFGGKLTDAKKKAANKVPLFLEKSLVYLDKNGLDCEGLFRVSGSLANVQKIKEVIEKAGGDVDYDKTVPRDAHEVAGIVKLYFRELQEPVVPTSMMREFVSVGANENQSLNEANVSVLLARLPPENYAVLKRLILFLKKVSEHAAITKMTCDNLALVFSPNLIRDHTNGYEKEMMWSGHISSVVGFMIKQANSLFQDGTSKSPPPPTISGATGTSFTLSGPAAPAATPPISSTPTTTSLSSSGGASPKRNTPTRTSLAGIVGAPVSGPALKRPPSKRNLSALDISGYTLRGEFRIGIAITLPAPPSCLQGCNWGPLVQTGKVSVYTSGESSLIIIVVTNDDGKTLAQAIAANIMDTTDSSRYFVVPRALSPILNPSQETGIVYYGIALYTPEDSITYRTLIDPYRPEEYITHKSTSNGTFVSNAANPNATRAPPPTRTAAFRKVAPPLSGSQGYAPGTAYRKMINLSLDEEELIVYERIVQLSYANVYRCSMGPLCFDTTKYLLRSLGSQFEENIFCTFYEYCGNNSIWELMYRHKVEDNQLSAKEIKHYATMVARALVYLHENKTPHRDIKSCNVFLDGDEEPFQVVKLGDVCSSLSLNIQWPIMYTSTFPYTPPEVLEDSSKVSTVEEALKVDVWQYGMLLVELETLGMPFEGMPEEDTQTSIINGKLPPNIPPNSPFLPIIRKCLQVNPKDRYSAEDILQQLNSLSV